MSEGEYNPVIRRRPVGEKPLDPPQVEIGSGSEPQPLMPPKLEPSPLPEDPSLTEKLRQQAESDIPIKKEEYDFSQIVGTKAHLKKHGWGGPKEK